MVDNKLLKKIESGEMVIGTHVFAGSPMLTECMAQAGYDAIWIDAEHTHITTEGILLNLLAAKSGGTPAVVRIAWNDPVLAKPVLDLGVDGIIFPYIRTPEEARMAVAACEYPPKGIRGFGPFRATDYFAGDINGYIHETSRNTVRMIQIEHIDAVNNLEEIADVEGIDAFIIGMNDLSGSMGYLGDTQNPVMIEVYERIAKVLSEKKRPFGVSAGSNEKVLSFWKERGATILFAGHDIEYVVEGSAKVLKMMKGL